MHRAAIQSRNKLLTSIFRLRRKDGEYVAFRAKAAAFRNPLSKKVRNRETELKYKGENGKKITDTEYKLSEKNAKINSN